MKALFGVHRVGFRFVPGHFLTDAPIALFSTKAEAESHRDKLTAEAREYLNPFADPSLYGDVSEISSGGWVTLAEVCEKVGLELPEWWNEHSWYFNHETMTFNYALWWADHVAALPPHLRAIVWQAIDRAELYTVRELPFHE